MIKGGFTRKIQCIERMQELTSNLDEILDFLFNEKIASKEECQSIKQSTQFSKELVILLDNLKQKEKLQLLEYEWMLLPVERICITLITDKTRKEFEFSSY